jgi:transposase
LLANREGSIYVAQGVAALRRQIPIILADNDNGLQAAFRGLLNGLREDLVYLDERVTQLDASIQQIARDDTSARRLQQLRGVGPITATALIAALGDGRQFKCGRDASAWAGLVPGQHSSGGKDQLLGASAWAGLVPGQHSSGGKDQLLGISKRGDAYLRTLLIHGARSVVKTTKDKADPLSCWVQRLCERRNKNIAAVALANKTMRMAWALLTKQTDYDPQYRCIPEIQPA